METRVLYQTDAYLKAFDATVEAVDGSNVALDATAFYPGGGGQPCDLGFLSGGGKTWPVLKVGRKGSTIWHEVEGDPPQVVSVIQGELDWDRRYSLMRTHIRGEALIGCSGLWRRYIKVSGEASRAKTAPFVAATSSDATSVVEVSSFLGGESVGR
ncbi:MAG: alanyl-tRNA editing protein [Chloroflexota bacterium]